MTDEELGKAIWKKIGSLYFEATLGAAARELLAKPVATREAVREWADARWPTWRAPEINEMGRVDIHEAILAALSHFAPPVRRMMIEGMAASDIHAKMREGDPNETFWHCARVAHRLATTPAPEVDAEAKAKKYLGMWMRSCHPNDAERSDEEIWNCYRQMHDAARSFAAGVKVVRG